MATEVGLKGVTVEVSDVFDVIITDVEQEEDEGDYVREIRVFGHPVTDGGTAPVVAILRIKSDVENRVAVTAPAQVY